MKTNKPVQARQVVAYAVYPPYSPTSNGQLPRPVGYTTDPEAALKCVEKWGDARPRGKVLVVRAWQLADGTLLPHSGNPLTPLPKLPK